VAKGTHNRIVMGHGSGGHLMHKLIRENFIEVFSNPILNKGDDSAVLDLESVKIAFTTDSYVIDPIFFPGGDIGKLAVCGTINDLAVAGAEPLFLSCGFILEEGFLIDELNKIIASMEKTAKTAGVTIVTGDTKIVTKHSADKIFINTSGIGIVKQEILVSKRNVSVGDKILINGYVGEHGIAVLCKREGIQLETTVQSDVAPINHLTGALIGENVSIRAFRDPTRGGIATTLNEFTDQWDIGIQIYEESIPISNEVNGACEILGLDPLLVANEGKVVIIVSQEDSERALKILRELPGGENSAVIGEIVEVPRKKVVMKTSIGGNRIVDLPAGELLPRIC